MNKNPRVRLISRIYLVTLGIISAWFLGMLAMADPKCAHCSVNMVAWAMPRAEILTGAWIIAGTGALWSARQHIAAFCVKARRVVNRTELARNSQNEV